MMLALRAARLASRRTRRQLAEGLDRVCSKEPHRAVLSAAIPLDGEAIDIARPVLEELAEALRSPEEVSVRGVALVERLLTEPGSALYGSEYPEELGERAREALLAL